MRDVSIAVFEVSYLIAVGTGLGLLIVALLS